MAGAKTPVSQAPAAPMSTPVYLAQMLMVATGIYVCFFTWGVYHEKIAAHKYSVDGAEKKFSSFLVTTLMVSLCSALIAFVCMAGSAIIGMPVKLVKTTNPRLYLGVGFTMTFAGPLSLNAAKHLSYPVFLTVKMCKMVPSVLMGRLWYGVRYSLLKYLAVVLITGGVVGFSLLSSKGDSKEALQSNTDFVFAGLNINPVAAIAVIVAFVGMTLDGYTVSTQDELNRSSPGLSSLQLMFIGSLAQAAWCVVALGVGELLPASLHTPVVKPEVVEALRFFEYAPQAFWDTVLLGLLNACGQVFVLYGVRLFGGLTLVALMTTRKIGSVFISIAVHGHTVTAVQWAALAVVVAGVVADTMDGIRAKNKKAAEAKKAKKS